MPNNELEKNTEINIKRKRLPQPITVDLDVSRKKSYIDTENVDKTVSSDVEEVVTSDGISINRSGRSIVTLQKDFTERASRKAGDNPQNDSTVNMQSTADGKMPSCSRYAVLEHPCDDDECDSENDNTSDEHCVTTNDGKRHRNYQFNFALNEYEGLKEHYIQMWTENTKYIIYQKEMSDLGYKHIQAYCELKNAVTFNKAKVLLGVKFVQPVAKCEKRRAMLYASKLETRMPGTEPKEIGFPSMKITNIVRKNNDVWIDALNAGSRSKALKIIKFNRPETYLCKKRIISESLDQEFGVKTTPNFTTFNIPFKNVWDSKCHVFIGPTNIGKTNYALAHFSKPVHIKGMQNFGRISENPDICDGCVIDDIPLNKLPENELLGICDLAYENNVNIKYSIGYIPQYLPRIICLNNINLLLPRRCQPEILDAINRRITIHNFSSKLYDNYIDLNQLQNQRMMLYRPRSGINVEPHIALTDVAPKNVTLETGLIDTTSSSNASVE